MALSEFFSLQHTLAAHLEVLGAGGGGSRNTCTVGTFVNLAGWEQMTLVGQLRCEPEDAATSRPLTKLLTYLLSNEAWLK